MIKILVCEDDSNDIQNLIKCIDTFFTEKEIKYDVDLCENLDDLPKIIKNYDLMFLDIELGENNGINIGLKLRQYEFDCIIIITTLYAKYAIEGYKVKADRYFLKPIQQTEFNMELESLISHYLQKFQGFYDNTIKSGKIYFNDILYIDFYNRKTRIHFLNGSVVETHYSLKYWIEYFNEYSFAQSHKSFVVNLENISGFTKQDIILLNDELIPLSRNYKKTFNEKYDNNLHDTV